MSGAPVIIEGRVVGIMRFALMENDRAELGTFYACPIADVKAPTLELPPISPLPPRRRFSAVAALASSMLLVAPLAGVTLGVVRAPRTHLVADLRVEEISFTLPDAQALMRDGKVVRARAIQLAGIRSIVPPASDRAAGEAILAERAEITTVTVDGRVGQLALDLARPLPESASVTLRDTPNPREFWIQVSGRVRPMSVGVVSPVDVLLDEAPVRQLRSANGDNATIHPLDERSPLELSVMLVSPDTVRLGPKLRVRDLSVASRFYDFPRAPPSNRSTIVDGRLKIGAVRDTTLGAGDVVRWTFQGSADIDEIAMSAGPIALRFNGTVTRLAIESTAGQRRNLMPTLLNELGAPVAAAISLLVGGLVGLLVLLGLRVVPSMSM